MLFAPNPGDLPQKANDSRALKRRGVNELVDEIKDLKELYNVFGAQGERHSPGQELMENKEVEQDLVVLWPKPWWSATLVR